MAEACFMVKQFKSVVYLAAFLNAHRSVVKRYTRCGNNNDEWWLIEFDAEPETFKLINDEAVRESKFNHVRGTKGFAPGYKLPGRYSTAYEAIAAASTHKKIRVFGLSQHGPSDFRLHGFNEKEEIIHEKLVVESSTCLQFWIDDNDILARSTPPFTVEHCLW